MANRLVGNIYIIDSATTAANDLQPVANPSWPREARIHTVLFTGTSGADFEMVFKSNTTNTAFRLSISEDQTATKDIHFGQPHNFDELRVKTLVNGTGFLYFA